MTWLLDFEGYSMRNAPAVRTSMHVLHTLQNHYPERLGAAVCYHAPTLFSMTWKVRCCQQHGSMEAHTLQWSYRGADRLQVSAGAVHIHPAFNTRR